MGSAEWDDKVRKLYASMQGEAGKKWARPEEPILHNLADERTELHVFYHNVNYRASRKYINAEKVKLIRDQALTCARTSGNARWHKCTEIYKRLQAACRVASNVDRGPLTRKRDVGFIYQTEKLRQLQQAAAELEIENPFPPVTPFPNKPYTNPKSH